MDELDDYETGVATIAVGEEGLPNFVTMVLDKDQNACKAMGHDIEVQIVGYKVVGVE